MDVTVIGPFEGMGKSDHQPRLQEALDAIPAGAKTIVFAPGEYALTRASGLRLPADATIVMRGARFVFAEEMEEDGQAFLLEDVSNVALLGGEVRGRRDGWDPGVNIRGVRVAGKVQDVTVAELKCADLSSNAVGVFGTEEAPVHDIVLRQVVAVNCCNYYGDYLCEDRGPAPGSAREDQGVAAFYHVDGWLVTGCRFEDSQSDGTHFYHCRNGRFVDSLVARSKMGGYFLEGCEQVLASGNVIEGNGSRGVTIERDSCFCTLQNNLVTLSGREGLWAPDVQGILVAGNIFRENGRKDDGARDCEIRLDDTQDYPTKTADIRIEGNLFSTTSHQTAAVYVGPDVKGFRLGSNTYRGAAPPLFEAKGA